MSKQLLTRIAKQNEAENKANSPSQQQLTDPSSVTVAGWKTLSFVCSGTITVTIDGNAIVY